MSAYNLTRDQSVELLVRTALEYGITDRRQLAYIVGTAQHETDNFNTSREYDGPRQAIRNGYRGGENYYGRGYVQVTHDDNYDRMATVLGDARIRTTPDIVAQDASIGARTTVVGMARGLYTGVGLDRYINSSGADYAGAREIVNGTDRAELIAGYARQWEGRMDAIVDRVTAQGITPRAMPGGPLGDGALSINERGPEVARMQEALRRNGADLVSDGLYGPATRAAVERYQRGAGLPPTGRADEATLERLGVSRVPPAPAPDATRPAPGQPGTPPPSVGPRPDADGLLREGERGPAVRQLQERLNAVGARDAQGRALGTDGEFGSRTEQAVIAFQRSRGLEPDGIAGPRTLAALEQATRARSGAMADGVLREGESGAEVTRLQQRLNTLGFRDAEGRALQADGRFGERTEQAVIAFQRARGLEPDGVAGPRTLAALEQPNPNRPNPGTPAPNPGSPAPNPPTVDVRSGWPVPGRTVINLADKPGEGGGEFGEPRSGGREHKGIDISGRVGDRIEAFAPGRVVFTGEMRGFGNTVIIQHEGGLQTVYAHLDRITVREDQQVDRTTQIATMGRSGNTPSTGDTHLHFEIREGANGTPLSGRAVDPRRYLHFEGETSQRVGEIQQHLQRLDIRDGRGQPVRADMAYGDRTREAVESFQRSRGIEVTGIVDPSTLDALRRAQPQQRQGDATPRAAGEPPAPVAEARGGDLRAAALAHPMVRQADAALQREQPGMPADQRLLVATTLADQGTRRGLTEINSIAAGPNGSWFAIQGDLRREDFQQASASREQIAQPLERQLASLAEQDRQRALAANADAQTPQRERNASHLV